MRLIFLLLTGCLLWSDPTHACMCVPELSFAEASNAKDEVFLARVSHYHPIEPSPEHGNAYENIVYLDVLEVFKGPKYRDVTALAHLIWIDPLGGPYSSSSCSLSRLDKHALFIVIRNSDEQISVGYCTGTHYVTDERLEKLRAAVKGRS